MAIIANSAEMYKIHYKIKFPVCVSADRESSFMR